MMKFLKIMIVTVLSLFTLNAVAFPRGYHGGYGYHGNGSRHNYNGYHESHNSYRGYGYRGYGHGYSRFGYTPWVIGGAFLFGAIVLGQNQTVYVDQGNTYQRVDTYCIDQYGQQRVCGYEWIQR